MRFVESIPIPMAISLLGILLSGGLFKFTGSSLNESSVDHCLLVKSSITATGSEQTTDSLISNCWTVPLTIRPTDVAEQLPRVQPAERSSQLRAASTEPTALTTASLNASGWQYDSEVSFYGPGFYGKRTACGLALTTKLVGVAHRSLPCGTKVQFRWKGHIVTTPVVDRGPYVSGRTWDLTGGACKALDHCFTGPIEWRIIGGAHLPSTDTGGIRDRFSRFSLRAV